MRGMRYNLLHECAGGPIEARHLPVELRMVEATFVAAWQGGADLATGSGANRVGPSS